jgi:hypothetical protein
MDFTGKRSSVRSQTGTEEFQMHTFKAQVTRRHFLILSGAFAGAQLCPALESETAQVVPQPYFAGVNRVLEALARLGAPVAAADAQRIAASARQADSAAVDAAETILDRYTLARLSIDADGKGNVAMGGAQRTLVEQGWRMFLVRIANPSGRTDIINFAAESQGPGSMMSWTWAARSHMGDRLNKGPLIEKMWVLSQLHEASPVVVGDQTVKAIQLSGVSVEYRIIELFSRDSGHRSDRFTIYAFSKSGRYRYDSGHCELDFDCLPSRTVTLAVRDADGRGCVGSLTIKDRQDRIYPPQAMRVAPDLYFQPQIYRADGEYIMLPDGEYTVQTTRGPEYLNGMQTVTIDASHARIEVKLQRWIDPANWGWYSGDTHIHAGGCSHYSTPTEGVAPETMIRQARGEGLAIGDVLSWAPSWYYQKQFFTGHAISPPSSLEHPELQVANQVTLQPHPTPEDAESVLRYDVEVSGFPSSHAGHLVLLRLRDQDYPGTKILEDWPSWNLPILQWARSQGALGGYAHCGLGMVVDSTDLPNYEIPPMDGVGTQEAIIDVTHGLVDFLSGCDTNPTAELNAWYHMMNCGFRMALVGETDYPCITDERMGVGRSYVRLGHRPVNDAGYETWVRGMAEGRLYCGDGRSHFLDFTVNDRRNGEGDLTLKTSGTLEIETLAAARLEPDPPVDMDPIKHRGLNGWHLEVARVGMTRTVPVELIVNGVAVDKATLVADGKPRSIRFKTSVVSSSWVALRIFPSSHTHPVFVLVGDKPIRASRRSAEWCRACVDKVWEVKSPFMRETERPAGAEAFDHARRVYEAIASECEVA